MSETEKLEDLIDIGHSQLVKLRDKMLIDEWEDDLTPDQQRIAALQLVEVQSAIRKLRRAKLEAIRDTLESNEEDLRSARRQLAGNIQGVKATAEALDIITDFLAVVGRIAVKVV